MFSLPNRNELRLLTRSASSFTVMTAPQPGHSLIEILPQHNPVFRATPQHHLEPPLYRRGIPCTPAVRTAVDLGAILAEADIDRAIDRGFMRHRFRPIDLNRELSRPSSRGRRGRLVVARSLERLGHVDGPPPSVLESATSRLLHRAGIEPQAREQTVVWESRQIVLARHRTDLASRGSPYGHRTWCKGLYGAS